MATYEEMESAVTGLAQYIDEQIEIVEKEAVSVQAQIMAMLQRQILMMEIENGALVNSQDFRKRLAIIERNIERILGYDYKQSIKPFLTDFEKIQTRTIDTVKRFSDIQINPKDFTAAQQIIYDRAVDGLTSNGAIAERFVNPVKQLIATNVLQGSSISKTITALENWDKGDMSSGRLNNGTPAPNFTRYATQIARDTAYSVSRTTNDIIKEKYGLTKFIYSGNLVKDSRPLCKVLVGYNRTIDLNELPPLIRAYPQGLYSGTNMKNFGNVCGGYNCLHICLFIA